MNSVCYITGAGENYGIDFRPAACDYVIAADGGLKYLKEVGIDADMVIGDFDTYGSRPDHKNVVQLNREKDITDTNAAIEEGLKLGYSEFHLYCCLGGKLDHTLANIQIMAGMAKKGIKIYLHGDGIVMTAVSGGSIRFDGGCQGMVSIFSHSDQAEGITLKGLKYTLDDACLSSDFPLGISNEFTGEEAFIEVKKGTLIAVVPEEAIKWQV